MGDGWIGTALGFDGFGLISRPVRPPVGPAVELPSHAVSYGKGLLRVVDMEPVMAVMGVGFNGAKGAPMGAESDLRTSS